MTEDKLGDSYDIVKRSLLRWLGGEWSVHPMLTAAPSKGEAAFVSAYESLVGASVISSTVLTRSNRQCCLAPARSCLGNLFLDPDKGLTLKKPSPQHLSADELVEITKDRSQALTVIFDQSFDRREQREQKILEKLGHLSSLGTCAFAYVSHACFIIAGERSLVTQARSRVITESGLPECRLTSAQ
jgi:hypothetical protein